MSSSPSRGIVGGTDRGEELGQRLKRAGRFSVAGKTAWAAAVYTLFAAVHEAIVAGRSFALAGPAGLALAIRAEVAELARLASRTSRSPTAIDVCLAVVGHPVRA